MAIECNDRTNEGEATSFLQSIGGADVRTEYKETGWWLGRYDKETRGMDKSIAPTI